MRGAFRNSAVTVRVRDAAIRLIIAVMALLGSVLAAPAYADDASPVYRFYNTKTGTHFYTISGAERDTVLNNYPQFAYEGAVFWAFTAPQNGMLPVYRFYNNATGTHFYTQSESEKNYVIATYPVFIYEGPVYYAPPDGSALGSTPLYRFYNTKTGAHFYTTSAEERDHVLATWPWFAFENIAYYVFSAPVGGGISTNASPKATLTASATAVTAPSTITLSVSATDADGSVVKVQFYLGGSMFTEVTSAPYTVTYNITQPGTFDFGAIAIDDKGALGPSNGVTVTASSGTGGGNNAAPKVTLATSATAVTLPASATLTATASDDDGTIASVKFYNGPTLVATMTSAPYTYTYTPSAVGAASFTAVATDNQGASTTSNAVTVTASGTGGGTNVAPKVTLATNSATVTLPGSAVLTASPSDQDGTIANVKFYNGANLVATVTTSPYTYIYTPSAVGTASFTAVATDNQGATGTSSAVTVTASGTGGGTNVAPKVTLSASSTVFDLGTSTTLTAAASDQDGTITSVVFKNGTTVVATKTTPPYTYTFTPTATGASSFTATATDNAGAVTVSNGVTVTAIPPGTGQPVVPKLTFTVSNTLVPAPGQVTLTASNVTSTAGGITRVSFYMNGTKLVDLGTAPYTFVQPITTPGTVTFTAEAQDVGGGVHMTLPISVVGVGTPASGIVNPDAWRLLQQATFGPTYAEAQRVQTMGVSAWINDQFTKPVSGYPDAKYNRIQLKTTPDCSTTDPNGIAYPADHPYATCVRDHLSLAMLQRDFFVNAVTAPDQLRQRVAWALSQIVVTSGNEPDLSYAHVMSRYQNIMFNNAFGNYQQLLMDVSLNPAMGNYLDMVNNDRAAGTRVPNENYAREIMQLFSIGLNELNPDGTEILDANGMPVPTYDQNTIKEMAKTDTGWTFADPATPGATTATKKNAVYYALPMISYPITTTTGHETSTKTLLNGSVVPPNQTPLQDIQSMVNNVFAHPNTPVYIGKQLIQRLVTGNPSPAYVQRVANVFVNNGSGVRGDMKAVIRAVLLDPEARGGGSANDPTYGSLKEPVLMITNLIRTLSGITDGNRLEGSASGLGQRPYYSPTVFNYFPPDQTIQGTTILAPEFLIHTTQTAISRSNLVFNMVYNPQATDNTLMNSTGTRLNTAQFEPLAANPTALVDAVDTVLMNGTMPAAAKTQIVTAVNAVPATNATGRAQMAVYLTASSFYYQVQH